MHGPIDRNGPVDRRLSEIVSAKYTDNEWQIAVDYFQTHFSPSSRTGDGTLAELLGALFVFLLIIGAPVILIITGSIGSVVGFLFGAIRFAFVHVLYIAAFFVVLVIAATFSKKEEYADLTALQQAFLKSIASSVPDSVRASMADKLRLDNEALSMHGGYNRDREGDIFQERMRKEFKEFEWRREQDLRDGWPKEQAGYDHYPWQHPPKK